MHDLTRRINAAMRRAKKRDGNMCQVCGRSPVDGAHILPRRSPYKWYHADDDRWIISLCKQHHVEYDKRSKNEIKLKWLQRNGLPVAEFLRKGLEGELNG